MQIHADVWGSIPYFIQSHLDSHQVSLGPLELQRTFDREFLAASPGVCRDTYEPVKISGVTGRG